MRWTVLSGVAAWLAAAGLLAACADGTSPANEQRVAMAPISFNEISGWADDKHADALASFRRSCPKLTAGPDTKIATDGGFKTITPAEWQAIFDVNVTGAFYFSQAVAPGMKAARRGRIVNISSGAGLGISLTGIQAYASAKAAQIGLTRQLAHELGPWGITVNNIAPGFVRSNPTTEKQWESYGEEGQRALVDRIALKRLGTPDDIASGVLFFASEYAGWITGQVLSIDGGK